VMLVCCLRCEHVLGGHLIKNAEGRRDVLNSMIIGMRKPPRVLVYDNACNLALTARKWAPTWAINMQL